MWVAVTPSTQPRSAARWCRACMASATRNAIQCRCRLPRLWSTAGRGSFVAPNELERYVRGRTCGIDIENRLIQQTDVINEVEARARAQIKKLMGSAGPPKQNDKVRWMLTLSGGNSQDRGCFAEALQPTLLEEVLRGTSRFHGATADSWRPKASVFRRLNHQRRDSFHHLKNLRDLEI